MGGRGGVRSGVEVVLNVFDTCNIMAWALMCMQTRDCFLSYYIHTHNLNGPFCGVEGIKHGCKFEKVVEHFEFSVALRPQRP